MSRDGRQHSAGLELKLNNLPAGCESLGLRRTRVNFARKRTRSSPMLSHETSPVLGASVVGITIWVVQRQSNLLADVPGITTTPGW
jgi:hypothetical protein